MSWLFNLFKKKQKKSVTSDALPGGDSRQSVIPIDFGLKPDDSADQAESSPHASSTAVAGNNPAEITPEITNDDFNNYGFDVQPIAQVNDDFDASNHDYRETGYQQTVDPGEQHHDFEEPLTIKPVAREFEPDIPTNDSNENLESAFFDNETTENSAEASLTNLNESQDDDDYSLFEFDTAEPFQENPVSDPSGELIDELIDENDNALSFDFMDDNVQPDAITVPENIAEDFLPNTLVSEKIFLEEMGAEPVPETATTDSVNMAHLYPDNVFAETDAEIDTATDDRITDAKASNEYDYQETNDLLFPDSLQPLGPVPESKYDPSYSLDQDSDKDTDQDIDQVSDQLNAWSFSDDADDEEDSDNFILHADDESTVEALEEKAYTLEQPDIDDSDMDDSLIEETDPDFFEVQASNTTVLSDDESQSQLNDIPLDDTALPAGTYILNNDDELDDFNHLYTEGADVSLNLNLDDDFQPVDHSSNSNEETNAFVADVDVYEDELSPSRNLTSDLISTAPTDTDTDFVDIYEDPEREDRDSLVNDHLNDHDHLDKALIDSGHPVSELPTTTTFLESQPELSEPPELAEHVHANNKPQMDISPEPYTDSALSSALSHSDLPESQSSESPVNTITDEDIARFIQPGQKLMLGESTVIAICSITMGLRLLLVERDNRFGLIGQSHELENGMPVCLKTYLLKVFDNNPMAYQKTLKAVEYPSQDRKGLYTVQVGPWRGIISLFQVNITLYEDFG
ncbi:MAG: hypothetical protein AAGI66_03465 [Cyanobacteria bacterium P01_H01_bin.74]